MAGLAILLALVLLAVAAALWIVWCLGHRQQHERRALRAFCHWLIVHAQEVRSTGAEYEGRLITPQTVFDPGWELAPSPLDRFRRPGRSRVDGLLAELVGRGAPVARLTPRAAEEICCRLAAGNYPFGTAVRIADLGTAGDRHYEVQFDDQPPLNGDDWRCGSEGLMILIQRGSFNPLAGLTIDFDGERFLFNGVPSPPR